MPHLDLEGLQKYAQKERKWADNAFDSIEDLNWQKTKVSRTVGFYPLPDCPLEPTLNFQFTETLPEEGSKSSSNPSTFQPVDALQINRLGGKNFFAYNFYGNTIKNNETRIAHGITASNNNGIYTLSGTSAADPYNIYVTHHPDEINKLKLPAGTYTLSGYTKPENSRSDLRIQIDDIYTNIIQRTIMCANGSITFTHNEDFMLNVYIRSPNGTYYPDGFVCSPQLELGTVATEYEPNTVDEYPIPLGSSYYGGVLDVANGILAVTHHGFVFNGTENFQLAEERNGCYVYIYDSFNARLRAGSLAEQWCSHYNFLYNWYNNSEHFYIAVNRTCLNFFTTVPTLEGFKAFVAEQYALGTPLTCIFRLATPQIIHIPPVSISSLSQKDIFTPRINILYTNANSIQVGYPKHPLRTQYELDNAILSLGGNE